jgi:hypothetical protein
MFSISQMINVFIFFLSFNLTSVLNYANILTIDWILSSKSHFILTKLTAGIFTISLYTNISDVHFSPAYNTRERGWQYSEIDR